MNRRPQVVLQEAKSILTLSNSRIRPFIPEDVAAACDYLNDEELWRHFGLDYPGSCTLQGAASHLAILQKLPRSLAYAVATLENDAFAGAISAQFGEGTHAYSAELSLWIGRPYWGSHIASVAGIGFTDWLFHERHALRVFAAPFEANRACIGALQASGFTFEGRLRNSVFKNGQLMDQMMYAKLNPACETLPRAPSRPSREQLAARRAVRQPHGTRPLADSG
jgi:[ribosomal protein S5]-alanine N-acetyltransferase